jgi:hypothetical protein
MARKKPAPSFPPSKAYLVSFGDTMTALLAFFIVLNSFAKDQTGANMHSGTGSFINAISSIGLPGQFPGDRTHLINPKLAPAPIYAVGDPEDEQHFSERLGPDSDPDSGRIIDRQTENFKRFLNEINRQFQVDEKLPTRSQIVFDSFEKLQKPGRSVPYQPLQQNAILITSETVGRLFFQPELELEIVVWATQPSRNAMKRAMETAMAIQDQVDSSFQLTPEQRSRISVAAKPWLFTDALRPKISFVLSRMDNRPPGGGQRP